MNPALSVIICTHNPREDYLSATIESLRAQAPLAGGASWELIVLDNASTNFFVKKIDLSWHANVRIVREERLGLTHARLRSFRESRGDVLVYIDDDNMLCQNYLQQALAALETDSTLGAAGGKVLPVYEVDPPHWFFELGIELACRDLGDESLYAAWRHSAGAARTYPVFAPIGAGMAIRRAAYQAYVDAVNADPIRSSLGRKGSDLASGEDNDIIMSILSQGYRVAYLPQLALQHLIPAGRLTREYLARYAYCSNRTWVQVLNVHGIEPWPQLNSWTVPLRNLRSYFRNRAWASDSNFIRWKAACGTIAGRSLIKSKRHD